jgi:pimeloyl-ACP methyl ester carboxylesterase
MRRFMTARRSGSPGSSAVFTGSSAVFISLAVVTAGLSACGHTPTLLTAQSRPDLSFATKNWSIRPSATLHWQNCPGRLTIVRCARLTVPLDYAKPHGRTIALALVDIPATAPAAQRLGPLLINPGGPGESGLQEALVARTNLPAAVATRYDIIGFDPRGVGHSEPQLHCDPSFGAGVQPPYPPASAAAERAQLRRTRAYAAGCERRFGWLLPHMTTADNARDLDAIRAALRVPKISYLGYSWGTYLGEVYATLFPGHVRRMVLDSIVGPGGMSYRFRLTQFSAIEARTEAFFSWAARHDAVYRLGGTEAAVAAGYRKALRQLAAHPLAGPSGPLAGPDELSAVVLRADYYDAFWPVTASLLAAYEHGPRTALLTRSLHAIASGDENVNAVFSAVHCSDMAWPRNWARWDADARRAAAATGDPYMAWGVIWGDAPCRFWPVRGPATPMKIGAPGLPGILLLQGTLDGATPYAGALAARRALPSARLVTVTGSGSHGQSLGLIPDRCANGWLARYLATGALPSDPGLAGATCASPPAPPPLRVPLRPAASPAPSRAS